MFVKCNKQCLSTIQFSKTQTVKLEGGDRKGETNVEFFLRARLLIKNTAIYYI